MKGLDAFRVDGKVALILEEGPVLEKVVLCYFHKLAQRSSL
jgi:hypothetical protein